jgi:hypothetical protein
MRRSLVTAVRSALLFGVMFTCSVPLPAIAGVDVGVGINIGPPPIVVAEPPAVVLVPRTQVYFVPGMEFDVFFHNGYWWSPRGERWYRARAYNGPWRVFERRHIPAPVLRVPRDYRSVYVRERHIPYGQWKKQHLRHERGEHRDRRDHRSREEFRHQRDSHERDDHRDRGDRYEHGRGHGR